MKEERERHCENDGKEPCSLDALLTELVKAFCKRVAWKKLRP
jgi:hypothetical protein